MRIKSFFAGAVETALNRARLELGPEAVLLSSRKAPREFQHLGRYEVVCGVIPAVESGHNSTDRPSKSQDDSTGAGDELERKLDVVRRASAPPRIAVTTPAEGRMPDLSALYSKLLVADFDPELAAELARQVEFRLTKDVRKMGGSVADGALVDELSSRFRVSAELGRRGVGPRVVVLVGPPGAGKTLSLVKLSVSHGLTSRLPIQWLSFDTYRIAAVDQLRTYASILGVGLRTLDTTAALSQALEEFRTRELVLIDTPGYGSGEMDAARELAEALHGHQPIDIHLVLPASMRAADMRRAVDRFEIFRPSHLLFTRMDETELFGAPLSEAMRTGKAISFLADGQRIPEDIKAATAGQVIELALRPHTEQARSAATGTNGW